MNIKWENLWFLPFMPAYWTAKNPWVGLAIGAAFIIVGFYFFRAGYKKVTLSMVAGIVWILFGVYEFSIWREYREYWELLFTIPVVYFFSLLGLIQIIKIFRESTNSESLP